MTSAPSLSSSVPGCCALVAPWLRQETQTFYEPSPKLLPPLVGASGILASLAPTVPARPCKAQGPVAPWPVRRLQLAELGPFWVEFQPLSGTRLVSRPHDRLVI